MSPTTIIFWSEPEVLNITPKIMRWLSSRLISVFSIILYIVEV